MKTKKIKKGVYEVTFRINLIMMEIIAGIAAAVAFLWWFLPILWKGIVWAACSLWAIKWWLLGAAGLALIIWLLSKIKWSKRQPRQQEKKDRHFPWWIVILLAIAALIFLLCRNCGGKDVEPAPVVTPERYADADGWLILDAYLSEGLNVKYADYQKFPAYGFMGTLDERKEVFGSSESYRDWREIFRFVEGKELTDGQLAAIIRYGLWNGLAGFEQSSICHKLQNGQKIAPEDFAKVYTSTGKVREYTGNSATHVVQYSWILAAVYQGDISIDEILDMKVKSYQDMPTAAMYTPQGKYIAPSDKTKDNLRNYPTKTTREILGW